MKDEPFLVIFVSKQNKNKTKRILVCEGAQRLGHVEEELAQEQNAQRNALGTMLQRHADQHVLAAREHTARWRLSAYLDNTECQHVLHMCHC